MMPDIIATEEDAKEWAEFIRKIKEADEQSMKMR